LQIVSSLILKVRNQTWTNIFTMAQAYEVFVQFSFSIIVNLCSISLTTCCRKLPNRSLELCFVGMYFLFFCLPLTI
jgi:hypothetical protein